MTKSELRLYKKSADIQLKPGFTAVSTRQAIFSYSTEDEQYLLDMGDVNAVLEGRPDALAVPISHLMGMIAYLRDGYHMQRYKNTEESYPGPAGQHENAAHLYPKLYEIFVQELSHAALLNIEKITRNADRKDSLLSASALQLLHGFRQDRYEMIFDCTERYEI